MKIPAAPSFSLRQLLYLVAAADTGTIIAAADELRVSPSAISDAITALEKQLQTQLCIRKKSRGLQLTAAGRRLVKRARHILAEANELEREAISPGGKLAGPIKIACYPTLAPMILPVLLSEFGAAHPGVTLEIVETSQEVMSGWIETGEVDVGIVYETMIPGNPRSARLFSRPAHVVLAASDPLANNATVSLAELADRDMILLDSPPSSQHTLSMFEEQGLQPKIRHRTKSFEVVRTLVARGLGYGILVQQVTNESSYEGLPLVTKRISPAVRPVGVKIIWSADDPIPKRVRALLDFALTQEWVN